VAADNLTTCNFMKCRLTLTLAKGLTNESLDLEFGISCLTSINLLDTEAKEAIGRREDSYIS